MAMKFAEIMYIVDDVTWSAEWYRDALGMKLGMTSPGWAELDAGGAKLGLMAKSGWVGTTPVLSLKCDALDAEVARLRARGLTIADPKGEVGNMRGTDCVDPDGNAVFLWEDGTGKL